MTDLQSNRTPDTDADVTPENRHRLKLE
jgi:hypothetical protein